MSERYRFSYPCEIIYNVRALHVQKFTYFFQSTAKKRPRIIGIRGWRY
ncbi:hypothetical protein HMPREF3038_02816 [Akkermansia sp. KLE1797]|nr:hypothetical protein HMPREF3038_02816 [Akkermansia sp. KLE1797]KXU52715.1 hypothetical protein HMPREF3039_03240 [Akkermansia sp. KLE1798]KZA04141.1 hypothetical protein HMPREF1326_02339 [Akkermansia sp. KLE1605]